ncbi:hypothetical protein QEH52_19740, partial [Coraliomargarita sp. SDUM461003]
MFEISRRGLVLVPGIKEGKPNVVVGEEITLYRPDGSVLETQIAGIEMINYHTIPREIAVPILLPKEIKKEEIPEGTLVYRKVDYHQPESGHNRVDGSINSPVPHIT